MRPKGRSGAAERPWGRFPFFFQAASHVFFAKWFRPFSIVFFIFTATAAFSASTSSERSDPTRSLLEKLSQTSIHHPNYGFNLSLKVYTKTIYSQFTKLNIKYWLFFLDWKWMYWNVSECIGSSWGLWKVKPIHPDTFRYIQIHSGGYEK